MFDRIEIVQLAKFQPSYCQHMLSSVCYVVLLQCTYYTFCGMYYCIVQLGQFQVLNPFSYGESFHIGVTEYLTEMMIVCYYMLYRQ